MPSSWIDGFVQRVLASGLADLNSLKGCSEAEIFDIESNFDVSLPQVYKDYLRAMGRESGKFLGECTKTYPHLKDVREKAVSLLRARTDSQLTETAFVFAERYGCQFFFFDTVDGSADPPIYRYYEGYKEPIKIADRFSDAMEMALEDDLSDIDPIAPPKPYGFTI